MKKIFLSVCTLFCFSAVFAQTENTTITTTNSSATATNATRFGIKGGLNITSLYIDGSKVNNEKYRIGGNLGFYGYAPITRFVGIQTEVIYSGKGTRVTQYQNSLGVNSGQINFNLHYLEIPVFAKINIGPLGLGAGLYGAYLLDANMSNISYRSDAPASIYRYEMNDKDFNKFDGGGLLDVSVNAAYITAGVRYTQGFRQVASTTAGETFLGTSKNAAISLYLGIGF
jgi:hypothetical protein